MDNKEMCIEGLSASDMNSVKMVIREHPKLDTEDFDIESDRIGNVVDYSVCSSESKMGMLDDRVTNLVSRGKRLRSVKDKLERKFGVK